MASRACLHAYDLSLIHIQMCIRDRYYDITKINEWLEDQEIDPLVQERGKGIFVSSEQSRRIQEAMSDLGSDNYHVFTPDERNRICLLYTSRCV